LYPTGHVQDGLPALQTLQEPISRLAYLPPQRLAQLHTIHGQRLGDERAHGRQHRPPRVQQLPRTNRRKGWVYTAEPPSQRFSISVRENLTKPFRDGNRCPSPEL
jgi:hypothetical protein